MAFSFSNLFYQSPEREAENNRHREETLRAKAERYQARAELVRARKGTPEPDGGPPEVGNFNVQAAIDSGKDDNMIEEFIEENPLIAAGGFIAAGLGVAKLLKIW